MTVVGVEFEVKPLPDDLVAEGCEDRAGTRERQSRRTIDEVEDEVEKFAWKSDEARRG